MLDNSNPEPTGVRGQSIPLDELPAACLPGRMCRFGIRTYGTASDLGSPRVVFQPIGRGRRLSKTAEEALH